MSDSYVTSKATLKCSFGDKTSKLTVYPDRTVELTTKPTANISDHISMYNIAPFGKCHTTCYPPTGSATAANHGHLTPMPCVPGTDTNWINGKDDYIIKGNPALLKSSYCRCKWGGVITITDDGQIDTGSADLSKENAKSEEEMKAETEEKQKIEPESVLDGIQLALDAAGLAPGVGAIPDLLNASISAIRGDWAAAGLSVLAAVPVIGDAATAAKFAKKGVKVAKAAKKVKAVGNVAKANKSNVSAKPLLSVTARPTPHPAANASAKPLLSVTQKKSVATSPKSASESAKFGSLTMNGRNPDSISPTVVKETSAGKVLQESSPTNSKDSLREVFKYKGNNAGNTVKPDNAADLIDLSF